MSDFVYRVAYPIEDDQLTTAQVTRQALLTFSDNAAARGIDLTGEPTAAIDGERVVCEAPASVTPGRRLTVADRHGLRIAELAAKGLSDCRIAEVIGDGLTTASVNYVRSSRGIPSGRSQRRITGPHPTEGEK